MGTGNWGAGKCKARGGAMECQCNPAGVKEGHEVMVDKTAGQVAKATNQQG